MASVDGSRSFAISSDQTFQNLCDPCKYTGVHKEATHYCNDCQEYLCKTCADSHKRLKLLRNHTLIPVSGSSQQPLQSTVVSNPVICDCDQNVAVTDFCETHNEVTCHSCKTIKHRKCNTCSIRSRCATEETLKGIIERADKQNGEIEASIKTRNKDLDNLYVMKEGCVDDIDSFAEQLKQFVETLRLDSLKDLDGLETEQRLEIEHQVASLTTTQQVLANDKSVLQLALNTGDKSAMFAADIKISKHLERYQTLLHDISEDRKRPKLEFGKDKHLIGIQADVSKLGTLKVSESKKLFPGLTVQSCIEIDIKLPNDESSPFVTGCVILPGGDILLCDRSNTKIKQFSKALNFIDSLQLQGRTWDASMVDETCVIVCLPDNKQLQYIEVKPNLKKGRVLTLDVECFGIDVVGDKIYISCPRSDGIHVLDMQGKTKRRIKFCSSDIYDYLKVKPNLNNMYVTDNTRDMLICLKTDGSVVYEYADKNLKEPRGLCVDDEGNAIVCGFNSHTLHVVNAMGKKVSTLRSAKDGLKSPNYISFIEESGTLILGSSKGNKLFVLKLA